MKLRLTRKRFSRCKNVLTVPSLDIACWQRNQECWVTEFERTTSPWRCWNLEAVLISLRLTFSASTLLVGRQEGHPACKNWVVGAGMVVCLEWDADLHMAQLMPRPLTISRFSKIQIGFTFLLPAYPGSPGKRSIKQVWVCGYCACTFNFVSAPLGGVTTGCRSWKSIKTCRLFAFLGQQNKQTWTKFGAQIGSAFVCKISPSSVKGVGTGAPQFPKLSKYVRLWVVMRHNIHRSQWNLAWYRTLWVGSPLAC